MTSDSYAEAGDPRTPPTLVRESLWYPGRRKVLHRYRGVEGSPVERVISYLNPQVPVPENDTCDTTVGPVDD